MKKQRGFSTPELLVSGAIMLGITLLTFDVMLTNTKLSAKSVQAAAAEAEQRTGIDILQKDLLAANATITKLEAGDSYTADEKKYLILRLPVIDGTGNVVAGKTRFVVYTDKVKNLKNCLVRLSGVQNGSAPFTLTETDVIATDLKDFEYRLARSTAIQPSGGSYPLPSTVTESKPSGSNIRLLSLSIPSLGVNTSNDPDDGSKRGLKVSLLGAVNLTLFGSKITPTVGTASTPMDVLYEIDPATSNRADYATEANQLKVFITVKGRDKQPDTTLTASGMMRNAQ